MIFLITIMILYVCQGICLIITEFPSCIKRFTNTNTLDHYGNVGRVLTLIFCGLTAWPMILYYKEHNE